MFKSNLYKSLSIATQLRYSLLLAVFLSVFVTAAFLIYISYQFQLDNLLTLQAKTTDATSQEISDYIDELQSNLRLLARIPGFANWNQSNQQNVLEGILRHNSAYENIAILDENQNITVAVSAYDAAFPDYLNLSTAFERAYHRGELFISPVDYNLSNQIEYVLIAVPIRNEIDEIDGVLLAQVNLEYLNFVTSQASVGSLAYVYIVDQQLRVIAQRNPIVSNEFETISDHILLSNALREEQSASLPFSYNGLYETPVFGDINDITGLGWHVVSELPVQAIYAPINNMLFVMLGGLLFGIIVALCISILLSRQVIMPLSYLTKIATEISSGNRNVIVEVKQNNEFGILAKTLKQMISQLNDTISNLEVDISQRERVEAELSKSEHKYRQLVNLAQEGIWMTDIDGNTTYVNPGMAKILGYEQEEMLGKSIYAFMEDSFIPAAEDQMLKRSQGIKEQFDFELRHKEGYVVYLNVEAAPVYNDAGNYIGAIAGLMDISSRKNMEQNRFQLALEQEKMQILTNFITQASHEFRTPLSIINTSLHLLSKSDDPHMRQRHTEKIKASADDITKLVDGLVKLTQLESIIELPVGAVEFKNLIEHVISPRREQLKSLAITLQTDSNLSEMIKGSESYLIRAFDELLSNAIRFSNPNSIICISATRINDEAIIEIKDTGIGIHPDDQAHIFERFYRSDKQGTTRGMGLGLPTAKRIIELHHGRIEIESTLGEGTLVRVALPLNLKKAV